jgi:hypothetical protein
MPGCRNLKREKLEMQAEADEKRICFECCKKVEIIV